MKKLVNKKGFTLIEMLIVVAIVGILVAIAVPTMNSSLDKANAAADEANLRTAKSQLAVMIADPDQTAPTEKAIYNPETGKFDGTVGTGEGEAFKASNCVGLCSDHKAAYITVVKENNELVVKWADASGVAITDQECN